LDKDQRLFPSRPKSPQDNPEQFVGSGKSRLGMPQFQNSELLPKSQVFQKQFATRTERLYGQADQQLQRTEHEPVVAEAPVATKRKRAGCFVPYCSGGNADSGKGRQRELNLFAALCDELSLAKTRSVCALFIGLRLLFMVLGVIR
jgi:hypothetical protein